jgi:hypothetical protein
VLKRALYFLQFSKLLAIQGRPSVLIFVHRGATMPAFYKIDKQRRLVVTIASGVLSLDDILQHQRQLSSDKDFDPTFAQLFDFNGIEKVAIAAEEVRTFAETSIFSPGARRAVVAEKNDVAFGLSRMFEIMRKLRGDRHIKVFRDRKQALAWLFSSDPSDEGG